MNVVLNAHKPLTVKDIQSELYRLGFHKNVDRRAIYSDLYAMVEFNYPIKIIYHEHNEMFIYRRLNNADVTDQRNSNVAECIS